MATAAPISIGSLSSAVAEPYEEQRGLAYSAPHGRHDGSAWKAFDRGYQRGSLSTSPSSLLGSYTNSLLEGRMSMNPPSPPVQFRLQLGALGSRQRCPPSLRCPPQINIDFLASWYEMAGPYVGSAALEHATPHQGRDGEDNRDSMPEPLTSRYGYRIPPKGQLQLVLKNQLGTIVKVLLIPYDLLDMPAGSKTFLRVRYVTLERHDNSQKGKTKEVTRYAVHLHFVSPPSKTKSNRGERPQNLHVTPDDGTTFDMDMDGDILIPGQPTFNPDYDDPSQSVPESKRPDVPQKNMGVPKSLSANKHPRIFLSKNIRLLFPSRTPDSDEVLSVIREEPGEGTERFSPWIPSDLPPRRSSSRAGVAISPTGSPQSWHVRKRSLLGR